MITGEYKVKKQKNGNIHNYTYYHCTKKNKLVKCSQPCIREEELNRQLSSEIQKVSLPRDWAEELEKMARNDFKNSAQSVGASVKEKETKISVISQKLERLLNTYLDQDIEKEAYRVEKEKLTLQKKSLEEEMTSLSHKHNDWLEPMLAWLKVAQNLNGIARDTDLFAKKVCAKEIFGSNLLLGEKTVRVAEGDAPNSLGKIGGNPWDALRASRIEVSKKPMSSILVSLLYQVRTYFQNR